MLVQKMAITESGIVYYRSNDVRHLLFQSNLVNCRMNERICVVYIKFSFSEKATKMCAIVLMILKFTYLVNVKTIRTIAQIFVAFSENLNFIKALYSF